jgi:carbon monoxide dehydrogenase subunit G
MQLEHSFTVPVGVDDAWTVLLDIEQIAPCMPGAAIDSVDGDNFTGTVKVKLGPIGLTYKGKASFVEKDVEAHRAVIDARGRDSRGNGTANAKVTATLAAEGSSTTVHVVTDLDITGKPAQFGRGVMVDVGNKLIGQFADCLAGKLSAGGDEAVAVASSATESPVTETAATESPTTQAPAAEPTAAPTSVGAHAAPEEEPDSPPAPTTAPAPPPPRPRPDRPAEVEPINLIESAGPAIAKRLVPVAIAAVLLFLVLRRRAKR